MPNDRRLDSVEFRSQSPDPTGSHLASGYPGRLLILLGILLVVVAYGLELNCPELHSSTDYPPISAAAYALGRMLPDFVIGGMASVCSWALGLKRHPGAVFLAFGVVVLLMAFINFSIDWSRAFVG